MNYQWYHNGHWLQIATILKFYELTLTQNASHITANLLLNCRLTHEFAVVKLAVIFVGNSLRWKNSTLSVCVVIICSYFCVDKYTIYSLMSFHFIYSLYLFTISILNPNIGKIRECRKEFRTEISVLHSNSSFQLTPVDRKLTKFESKKYMNTWNT